MARYRSWITTGLVVVGLVVLFVVFIAFRDDAALIAALEAAGTVAAAGFAAVAGVAAMRAANESSATARRAREAQARTARPRLSPRVTVDGDRLIGVLTVQPGPAALDVTVAWLRTDGETITTEVAEIAPGADGVTADLGPAPTGPGEPAAAMKMIWLEYSDDNGVGQWHDTWQVVSDRLTRSTADLVD